jgi:DegV family protein with EDD domain
VTVGIAYLDGPRLARSLYAASDWVAAGREEINRINVFPVPDGDTGTNFSLTLRTVADAVRALGDASLSRTAQTMSRAAVMGARGNSGMMLAHFLLGFSESLGDRGVAKASDIANALQDGAENLYAAIDDPREGTILTVAREAAEAARIAAAETEDLSAFMRRLLDEAEASLERTPELMAVLKEAGVVDAGGKGFVSMLEGIVRFIEGDPILPVAPATIDELAPAADIEVSAEEDYQYCTEVLVEGEALPPANQVRAALRPHGGSLVVAATADVLKIHVHTDTPELVFTLAEQWGTVVTTKADDMRAQHRHLSHETRPVAMVADSSADLSDAILDRHGITLVPLQVIFGDETFLDRVQLTPEEFYARLRTSPKLPTTSQPTPAEFVKAFRDARDEADAVVAVLLSCGLSGTFQSAQAAVKASGVTNVHLIDSKTASLGLGMLALKGAELAEAGWAPPHIVRALEKIRDQSGTLVTVDQFDNLLRSGRVSRGKAWLGGMLDVKPILGLDDEGRILPVGKARGRDKLVPEVLRILKERLTPSPKVVRFGIAHAEAPEVAERVRKAIVAAFQPKDCIVARATGVLGTHVGIGAWAVFYQVEDGIDEIRAGSGEGPP